MSVEHDACQVSSTSLCVGMEAVQAAVQDAMARAFGSNFLMMESAAKFSGLAVSA